MAKDWSENFNELVKIVLPCEGNKEWRMVLEEHKTKGTMQINCRKWQLPKEGNEYNGPTKNGFIEPITSVEDITKLEETFKDFFAKIKEML